MTKYPIVLVHGIAIKELKLLKAFGRIESQLRSAGFSVYTADTDAFGSIDNNAAQLKEYISNVLRESGAEKVNIIAHSKGGLDTKRLMSDADSIEKIASVTTLCTPHKGSHIASRIWALPMWIKKILAFFINGFYKLIGDRNPDSLKVCEELKATDEDTSCESYSDKVYCQSYSTKLKRGRDCLLMAVPMKIYTYTEGIENDGVVSEESAKFENYRGECLDDSVSHTQIVDFLACRRNRKDILDFYVNLCRELSEMGY